MIAPLLVTVPLWKGRFARRGRGARAGASPSLLGVLIAAVVLAHFVPTPSYLVYFASVAPLIAAACAIAATGRGIPRLPALVGAAAVAGLLVQDTVFVHAQPYPLSWVAEAGEAAVGRERGWHGAVRALRERTGEEAEIWSFDTSLVVQAGRRVLPGFEMSYFGFYPLAARDYAQARGLLDLSLAIAPLRARRAAAVVASRKFTWDNLRNAEETRAIVWRQICGHYRPEARFDDAVYGPIWLLLPRGEEAEDPCCERLYAPDAAGPSSCPEGQVSGGRAPASPE